ncbi:hypothetical protein [Kitasatospora sp. GP82]|uniref:hypothetical protein n=1 Tax=Kitasatospora sp. GP82 TaxID=3035089 RepID=UPI002473F570|nr:hypothetical protein [Kitasatospora sp. GP82]MDH6129378.1 hypothetical protein [Kitasatospora sp. GP82]
MRFHAVASAIESAAASGALLSLAVAELLGKRGWRSAADAAERLGFALGAWCARAGTVRFRADQRPNLPPSPGPVEAASLRAQEDQPTAEPVAQLHMTAVEFAHFAHTNELCSCPRPGDGLQQCPGVIEARTEDQRDTARRQLPGEHRPSSS